MIGELSIQVERVWVVCVQSKCGCVVGSMRERRGIGKRENGGSIRVGSGALDRCLGS